MIEDVFGIMSNPAYRASLPMMGIMYNTVFMKKKIYLTGLLELFPLYIPKYSMG